MAGSDGECAATTSRTPDPPQGVVPLTGIRLPSDSASPIGRDARAPRFADRCLTGDMPETQPELPTLPSAREQVLKILETGTTESVDIQGLPVVLMTLKGAKTGKLRYTPVMRVEHDGTYVIVASLGGSPKNPAWYNNVKANPQFSLQDGSVVKTFVAREVEGAERAIWWERAVEAFPTYAEYQTRTDRIIPVFVLEPTT